MTAGAEEEWTEVAVQTSWQNRTECLSAIPLVTTAMAMKPVRMAESDFLDMKGMHECHGGFALFTLFIRLVMVPICASCNDTRLFFFLQAKVASEAVFPQDI